MFNLFVLVSGLFVAKEVIQETLEPVAPPEQHFDWGAYYDDIDGGIAPMEQVRKCQKGGYNTCEPIPVQKTLRDYQYEKYLKDKADNPAYAEAKNQMGAYGWRC